MKVAEGPHRPEQFGLDPRVCWGVFVGGCVAGDDTWRLYRTLDAHAHNRTTDEWQGWMCILAEHRVVSRMGRPTGILMHEYAHLLCPDQLHTARWARTLTDLGFPAEAKKFHATKERPRAVTVPEVSPAPDVQGVDGGSLPEVWRHDPRLRAAASHSGPSGLA